jgi:hypothetical protein
MDVDPSQASVPTVVANALGTTATRHQAGKLFQVGNGGSNGLLGIRFDEPGLQAKSLYQVFAQVDQGSA